MEKSDRPVKESWFSEGDIVDAELLVDLLETFRFGKANFSTGKIRSTAETIAPPLDDSAKIEAEEDDGSQGSMLVDEITASVSSNSDPILLANPMTTMSETGSSKELGPSNEAGPNEVMGDNWLESSSTNLPNVENEMQQNVEDAEKEEEETEQNVEHAEKEQETEYNVEHAKKEDETQDNAEDTEITEEVEQEQEKEEEEGDENRERSSLEFDLEKLLATQENYELYCPSCTSCITRKVIIKKRQIDESRDIEELEPPVKVVHVPESERFFIELLKSTVYGGLTETVTSLGVVSSASASGCSTENILALTVANMAGGLVILAQNLYDLRNDSDQDRYKELLGRRANIRIHILVAVLSYILFGLIPPLVYAFSFYETGIKNYKLISVFSVSLVCVILLGMIRVYVRKSPNVRLPSKSYLKSAAFYTSIVLASSGLSYVVGDYVGEYIGKLGWFSLDQVGMTSPFYGANPEDYRFTSFAERSDL